MTDRERFDSFVNKSGSCWLWTGGVCKGYGMFSMSGRSIKAHRAAYAFAKGPIPSGAWVCHHCDVKLCVNPDHLYAGDVNTNARDATDRGRYVTGERHHMRRNPELVKLWAGKLKEHPELHARGERCHTAKMVEDDVRVIRALHSSGVPVRDLCESFGLASRSSMWSIIKRQSWRHVI